MFVSRPYQQQQQQQQENPGNMNVFAHDVNSCLLGFDHVSHLSSVIYHSLSLRALISDEQHSTIKHTEDASQSQ